MPTPTLTSAVADGLLAFHVAAGFLSLFVGGAAMVLRKGDARHRRLGRIFTAAMLAVSLSALALAAIRPTLFLSLIALFSAYLALTGWRALADKPAPASSRRRTLRLSAIPAAGLATAVAMLGLAGADALAGALDRSIILGVFGAGLAAMAARDLSSARRGGPDGRTRTARHIQRMIGAWIASLTAFAVVNLSFLPDLVVWLGPTALVSPLIGYWTRRHAPAVRAWIA